VNERSRGIKDRERVKDCLPVHELLFLHLVLFEYLTRESKRVNEIGSVVFIVSAFFTGKEGKGERPSSHPVPLFPLFKSV